MVWQDVFPNVGPKLDGEHERELRLVEQARAGADWALAALIARYQPPVTRYLTRLTGSPMTARPLAEQVFIRMERRLHGSQGGRQLRLWLLRACTEAGLEMLRGPREAKSLRLVESRSPVGLLPGASSPAVKILRAGLGKLATMTGSTSRQVRKLIWSDAPESVRWSSHAHGYSALIPVDQPANDVNDGEPEPEEEEFDTLDPREALRHRMVRAVLAELPYGDAQCLALHLVAGLNQAEVALALGITASATRRRIVHGLTLFAQRYDAAAASLGLPLHFYEAPNGMSAVDGARLDRAERPMPMVEAIADELDPESLTTNEHIAVHPFRQDDEALIWNGRIHNEIATQVNDVTTNVPVGADPLIVEASLAHVGEPVGIPKPVATFPPPPHIPLTVTDMWVQAEAHSAALDCIVDSPPLILEDISLQTSIREGEMQRQAEVTVRSVKMVNDTNDVLTYSDMGVRARSGVEGSVSIDAREVPILTGSTASSASHNNPTFAAPIKKHPDGSESIPTSVSGNIPIEMGQSVRAVPVLTAAQRLHRVAVVNVEAVRIVPVLTSSPSDELVTLPGRLRRGEESGTGDNTETGMDITDAVNPTGHPHAALAGRSGIETTNETL